MYTKRSKTSSFDENPILRGATTPIPTIGSQKSEIAVQNTESDHLRWSFTLVKPSRTSQRANLSYPCSRPSASQALALSENQKPDRTFPAIYTSFCKAAPSQYRPQSVFNKLAQAPHW